MFGWEFCAKDGALVVQTSREVGITLERWGEVVLLEALLENLHVMWEPAADWLPGAEA